jgi:hypothetical protein
MRRLALYLAVLLFWSITAQANQLVASATRLTSSDVFVVDMKFDKAVLGDVYLAFQIPPSEVFYFLSNQLTNSTETIAFRNNVSLSGSYRLFSIPARIISVGNYRLYAVAVKPASNPFEANNWLGEVNILDFEMSASENADGLCVPPEKWHAEMAHCMVF